MTNALVVQRTKVPLSFPTLQSNVLKSLISFTDNIQSQLIYTMPLLNVLVFRYSLHDFSNLRNIDVTNNLAVV